MGMYYSLISGFSSPTSTHNRNAQPTARLKSTKKRRRRPKRHHLLNRFFLGTNHFVINTQAHTCLFHEYYTLNSNRDTSLPVQLHLSLPELNHSTIICPIQCTVAIRRDSLKLIHCYENWYSIDFIFDADRPVELYIYFMAHEVNKHGNGSLSYVCCGKSDSFNTFEQYYAFTRPAGHGQVFSSIDHHIRFPLSALHEDQYSCAITNRLYPIAIVCRASNEKLIKSSSTICGMMGHTMEVVPTFDQFHIVLATVKSFPLTKLTETTDHASIMLLSQKHVYNGILFKLFELYGIENHPSNFSTANLNDRQRMSTRKKSLIKAATTPTFIDNELLLYPNPRNHSNEISSESKRKHQRKKSASCLELLLNNSHESTCVICLTDMRNVLLLPCRHVCLCGTCAEHLKLQSANCPICRIPFRALLQMDALRPRPIPHIDSDENENDDQSLYESISLIDALNLSTTIMQSNALNQITTNDFYLNRKAITTADFKYFCSSEHTV